MTRRPAIMARIVGVIFFGALALAHAQTQRDAPRTVPTGTAVLSGVVKDRDGNPLRRTAVTLAGENDFERLVMTDDAGRFAFTSLPAGRFKITAEKPGYPPMSYGATRPNRSGAGILLTDGQQVTDITLTLARGAVLAGTVYDDRGLPMPGVPINAWEVRTSLSGERTLDWFAMGDNAVTSDDRGAYRIFGLPPGEYTIGTSWFYSGIGGDLRVPTDAEIRDAFLATTQGGTPSRSAPSPAQQSRYNYAPVFHPSSLDPLAATTYQLAPGEVRDGIDLHMRFQAMSRLDGLVLAPDGTPAIARMSFSRRTRMPGSNATSVFSPGPDGRFTRASIGPGDYTILAEVAPNAGAPALFAVAEFTVAGAEPVNVTLRLQPALTMTGQLRFESTRGEKPPADPSSILVYVLSTGSTRPSSSTKTEKDGTFTVTALVPGQYRVAPTLAAPLGDTWMVRSVTVNGRDVTDVPFDLANGDATAQVTFTDQLSELSGTVTTTSGPATDYFVVVIPADRQYWQAGRRKVSARPDANGHFLFRKLPPGEYRIAATTDLVESDLTDTGALERLLAASTPVTIAPGEKKVFDFKTGR